MMRLSATLTRRLLTLAADWDWGLADGITLAAGTADCSVGAATVEAEAFRASPSEGGTEAGGLEVALEDSSSQTSMVNILWIRIMEGCCEKHQALLDIEPACLLQANIESGRAVRNEGRFRRA